MKKPQRIAQHKRRRLDNASGRQENRLYEALKPRVKLPVQAAPVITAPLPIPVAPVKKRGFWGRLFGHKP